ncbi:MAG: hypothetical protein HW398_1315 [Acidobacteria bacterium]|nr:hypothetical protein [Acidobacteriota bacterium]
MGANFSTSEQNFPASTFLLALLSAGLAAIGYWMLFSNLALYDDEGYLLLSAREYFAHGGLYDSVYSGYGPAFYVLADAFQWLIGSPVDHSSARLLTLGPYRCMGSVRSSAANDGSAPPSWLARRARSCC